MYQLIEFLVVAGIIFFVVFIIKKRKKLSSKTISKNDESIDNFNLKNKSLEWFLSENGINCMKEYTKPQNYIREETLKKEYNVSTMKEKGISFESYLSTKDEKLPSKYFMKFVECIPNQFFLYAGPVDFLTFVLKNQASTIMLDEDGEPVERPCVLDGSDIMSFEKNAVLNYAKNFNCYELKDDAVGSFIDKFNLWTIIIRYLSFEMVFDKNCIENSKWVFDKSIYINELGTIRKQKSFVKKCLELSQKKEFFEEELKRIEEDN